MASVWKLAESWSTSWTYPLFILRTFFLIVLFVCLHCPMLTAVSQTIWLRTSHRSHDRHPIKVYLYTFQYSSTCCCCYEQTVNSMLSMLPLTQLQDSGNGKLGMAEFATLWKKVQKYLVRITNSNEFRFVLFFILGGFLYCI